MTLRISPPRIALAPRDYRAAPRAADSAAARHRAPLPRAHRAASAARRSRARAVAALLRRGVRLRPAGDDAQESTQTFTWADGNKYVGQWKDNEKHGLGKFTLADGEVHHDGEWENDQPKK